ASATLATADSVVASGPCPSYSLTEVLADSSGDWDSDRLSNADEFYGLTDPCTFDAQTGQNASAGLAQAGGPCPSYSLIDVLDDPNGDWDGDRATNVTEFYDLGDPCIYEAAIDGEDAGEPAATGPCPSYSLTEVLADPTGDWDGDTATNADEF
ncbi:MAG: hypothetical protein ACKVKO_11485, partial [Acidimicrobiales bacterium]